MKETPRPHKVSTSLSREELAMLKKVHRYVIGWSGKVPRSEALRFLVRNWTPS